MKPILLLASLAEDAAAEESTRRIFVLAAWLRTS
ncbi:UNVERIFIED_ORG: hypothetical protein ABIB19_002116 [Arthrobacter sp. UYEF10]